MSIFNWLHGEKNNFSATVDPTVNDDSTQGYAVGSGWINITPTPARIFMLGDATPGAAEWVDVTDSGGDMLQAVYDPTGQSTDAFNQAVGGDLTGTTSAAAVTGIQTIDVNAAIVDTFPLTFDAIANEWRTIRQPTAYNLTSQNGIVGVTAATIANKTNINKTWAMIDYAPGVDEAFNWEVFTPATPIGMNVEVGWVIDAGLAGDVIWDVLMSGITDASLWSNPQTTDSVTVGTSAVDTVQIVNIPIVNGEISEFVAGTINIELRRNGSLDTFLNDARVFWVNVIFNY